MRKKLTSLTLVAMLAFVLVPNVLYAAENTLTADPISSAVPNSITITGILAAMSGVSAPATLTVTVGATTYTVEVTTSTKIVRKFNGVSDGGEMMVGDILEVKGVLSDATANLITANKIKDISVQRAGGTFKGAIVTLDCTNNKFTFKPNERQQQTVYISSTTKIIRGGEKIACTDLNNGEKALVIGLWRQASKRIDADRIIVSMKTLSGTISAITLTGTGLPATLTVDLKNGQKWTVNVTSSTKLFRRYMGTATINEFLVGDKVEARGTQGTGLVLNARVVRDNSVVIKNRDFVGTISSIDSSAQSFVIPIKRKGATSNLTVTTTSATKFYNDGTAISFADLTVGAKVKVLGVYNETAKTLAASRVFIED